MESVCFDHGREGSAKPDVATCVHAEGRRRPGVNKGNNGRSASVDVVKKTPLPGGAFAVQETKKDAGRDTAGQKKSKKLSCRSRALNREPDRREKTLSVPRNFC